MNSSETTNQDRNKDQNRALLQKHQHKYESSTKENMTNSGAGFEKIQSESPIDSSPTNKTFHSNNYIEICTRTLQAYAKMYTLEFTLYMNCYFTLGTQILC